MSIDRQKHLSSGMCCKDYEGYGYGQHLMQVGQHLPWQSGDSSQDHVGMVLYGEESSSR